MTACVHVHTHPHPHTNTGLEGRRAIGEGRQEGREEWRERVVASIDPDCEFVGNSHFSPNMTLMGQSLADWAGTHGDRRKCPSILRSPAPDGAEVFSVKAQLARWAARAHLEKAWSF